MTAWTQERIEQAGKMWRDGMTASHIARVMGVTRNGIISKARDNRDLFPPKQAPRITVDLEGIAKLWNAGTKAAEIAEVFGVKPGYVRGLASSNRDLFTRKHGGTLTRKPRSEQAPKPRARRKAITSVWQRSDPSVPRADLYKPIELDEYELTLLPGVGMMENTGCKYPLTERGPHRFCGCEASGSWCSYHAEKIKGHGTESERRATTVKGFV